VIAYTASVWTQVIVAISIFVPVLVTIAITWAFLRSARNDPDEQRRRKLDAERRAANAAESRRSPT
jgi:heme/copper-type cytochrome/quinol oxidase subunit 2